MEKSHSKIVWINARFLARPVTGVERVARELISALAQQLDEHGAWTTSEGGRLFFRLIAPARDRMESPWPRLPADARGPGGGHFWEQTSLPFLTQGDWLVSLCNTGPMLKRRQVLFLHDAQPFAIPDNFTWQFRLWYRLLFSVAGRMSRVILTNSEFSRDDLARRVGLPSGCITPVGLGVDHVGRVTPDHGVFAKHGVPDEPFVLAVSSVNPNKNFRAVRDAMVLLGPEAPLCVVAGQRYDKVFGGTAREGGRAVHLGYVSDAELYALYSKARCLLFPSIYEGFGLPPLEAMALGCPAIVSDTTAMPEVCGDAALYCDPLKPETLAAAIRRLWTEPGLHDRLVDRGKERARLHSWSRGANRLLETLTRAMGDKP